MRHQSSNAAWVAIIDGMHEADAPNPVITDMPLAAKTKIFKDDDENFLGLSSLGHFPGM
ncbi:MAG: hypothetical protein IPK89_13925 [Sphingomonadales bacterium]|nr:hypothetical protein [Sphingomonadales bacterium]